MREYQSNTTEAARLTEIQPRTTEGLDDMARTVGNPLEWIAFCASGNSVGAIRPRILNATGSKSSLAYLSIFQMQRRYGNRYVQRMLALARQGEGEGEVTPNVESAIKRARGGGQGLASGIRGQDIFLRDGAYEPGNSAGKELLAHELTHVVQQGGAIQISGQVQRIAIQRMCPACEEEEKKLQGKLVIGEADDQYEQEADRIAKVVVSTMDVDSGVSGQSGSALRSSPLQPQYALNGRASIGMHADSKEQRKFNVFEFSNSEHAIHRQDDSSDAQDSSQQGDTSLGQSVAPDSTNMLDTGQDPRSPSCSPTQSLPISATTGSFPKGNVYSPSFTGTPGTTVTVNATGSYDTNDPNCSPMAPGSEDYRVTLFQCRSILADVEVGTSVSPIGSPLTFSATLPTTGIFANAVYYLQFRNGSSHCNIIVGYSVR